MYVCRRQIGYGCRREVGEHFRSNLYGFGFAVIVNNGHIERSEFVAYLVGGIRNVQLHIGNFTLIPSNSRLNGIFGSFIHRNAYREPQATNRRIDINLAVDINLPSAEGIFCLGRRTRR